MKYMLLIYGTEQAWDDAGREQCYAESAQPARDLSATGHYVSANPLHSVSSATSVRVRGGKRLVTDGPFAETYEHLGGYFLIDAKDLDEAIEIAARIPAAGSARSKCVPCWKSTACRRAKRPTRRETSSKPERVFVH